MTETILLRDWAVVMMAAGAATVICHALKQPTVLGYLLAGLLVGPHTPPFSLVKDLHSIHTLATLGLIFLLFALGLEFSLPQLRRVGPRAAVATLLEVIGMGAIGYFAGQLLGWNRYDSLFLGAILSISSTTIIVKVFMDLKLMQEDFARLVLGILVLEDIVAIVILTFLSGLGASSGLSGPAVLESLWRVSLFTGLFILLGLAVIPPLMHRLMALRSREILGISTVGLCLASALLAHQFGFSVALGAFLIGTIIRASRAIHVVESWMHPIRDLFSALFFVSAGMLLDPRVVVDHWEAVLLITAFTVVGKIAAGSLGALAAGYSLPTSVKAGVSLAQIGEFAFVFAGLALASGKGSAFLYPLAVAVSAITTMITPFLIRRSDAVSDLLIRWMPGAVLRQIYRYGFWRENRRQAQALTPVLLYSKYLIRFGIYLLFFVGGWLLLRKLSPLLGVSPAAPWLWMATYLTAIPLLMAIAYYANHFFLLFITETLARYRQGRLLHWIPIHRAYQVFESVIIVILSVLIFLPAYGAMWGHWNVWLMVIATCGLAWLARRPYRRAYLSMETLLDEVMGLATSDPVRAAGMSRENTETFWEESTDEFLVEEASAARGKSLRTLNLRNQTGANVIALYRKGRMIPNPSPDESLDLGDILVLLGDSDERARAREILAGNVPEGG